MCVQGISEPSTPRAMSRASSSMAVDSSAAEASASSASAFTQAGPTRPEEVTTGMPIGSLACTAQHDELAGSYPEAASPAGWQMCGSSALTEPGRQQHGFWANSSSAQVCFQPPCLSQLLDNLSSFIMIVLLSKASHQKTGFLCICRIAAGII